MSLSCSCDSDWEWFFYPPDDYTTAPMEGRRHRCSCGALIGHGTTCVKFNVFRNPKNDIEEKIHGEEVPMAPKWLCERCGDLYFSFLELGYECVQPEENMVELAEEYADEKQYEHEHKVGYMGDIGGTPYGPFDR